MKQLKKTVNFAIVDQNLIVQLTVIVLQKVSFIKQQLCITTRKIFTLVQLEDNSKADFMNIRNSLKMQKRKYNIK